MLLLRIWNYFLGYLVIRVDGLSLEKFINLCVSKGIHLWKINRLNYTTLTACISIGGFKKLRSVTRVVHCRVKIVEKMGFPFVAFKLRHRRMLVMGMVIFLVILYGLSSFIWTVEVEGARKVDPHLIIQKMEQYGIKPGAFKRNLNISAIENRMIIDISELSWVSIEIRGTKVIAHVVESVKPPVLIDKTIPCNIVASRDGIIEKIIALEGETMVKVGDTVKKGQVLVSGVIDHPDTTGVRYVHAMAQIMARTWYEGKASVSFKDVEWQRTGRKVVSKYMEMKDWQIKYDKKDIPFKYYEIEEKRTPFFGEGRFLPVYMVVREYYELKRIPGLQQKDMLIKKAEDIAWDNANKKIPSGAKIIDKKFKYDIIEGKGVNAVLYLEVLENIAQQKRILLN